MKKGKADARLGKSNKTEAKKPKKNDRPPKVGVGRVCHRSFFGSATQPHRAAKRRTNGTHKIVIKNEAAGARKKMALLQVIFMQSR